MKIKVFLKLIVLACFLTTFETGAFKLKLKKDPVAMIDYDQWLKSVQLPDEVNDVKQYYPSTETVVAVNDPSVSDTVAVIRGHVAVKDMDARQVFLATMVYSSDHIDREEGQEGFEEIDFKGNWFRLLLKKTCGSNANEATYTRSIVIKAVDGGFDFIVSDIDCRYREKGLIPRTLRLEKLHPDRNKRHEALVREIVAINSSYIAGLAEYVASRKGISSPNFEKLRSGADVALGMNEDEVTILLGPPVSKRRSGDRTRWIYANDYVLIFTDGLVTKIVQ